MGSNKPVCPCLLEAVVHTHFKPVGSVFRFSLFVDEWVSTEVIGPDEVGICARCGWSRPDRVGEYAFHFLDGKPY